MNVKDALKVVLLVSILQTIVYNVDSY